MRKINAKRPRVTLLERRGIIFPREPMLDLASLLKSTRGERIYQPHIHVLQAAYPVYNPSTKNRSVSRAFNKGINGFSLTDRWRPGKTEAENHGRGRQRLSSWSGALFLSGLATNDVVGGELFGLEGVDASFIPQKISLG